MFESSLIDLEAKKQPQPRRWLSLPLAIVLHLVGLTAFAFASYWSVGPVQEPQANLPPPIIEVSLPEIQRGGGIQRPKPPETRTEVKPPVPDKPVQPDPEHTPEKPRETATREVLPDPGPNYHGTDPTAPAREGDRDGSDDSNNTIGLPNQKAGPEAPADDGPHVLTAEMSRPVPLRPILPRYTESGRKAGVQGMVIVEAIIDEKGNATNVRILQGLPMGLDRAAVEAIQQTRFKPAMVGSRPVKVYFTLTVNFTIQR
ncbi:MAG TPA: TonB family protein [Thermoanaerobaculia bacterium]|nr:TonB family protein [Thermoanaerobaculia bacterium]